MVVILEMEFHAYVYNINHTSNASKLNMIKGILFLKIRQKERTTM